MERKNYKLHRLVVFKSFDNAFLDQEQEELYRAANVIQTAYKAYKVSLLLLNHCFGGAFKAYSQMSKSLSIY